MQQKKRAAIQNLNKSAKLQINKINQFLVFCRVDGILFLYASYNFFFFADHTHTLVFKVKDKASGLEWIRWIFKKVHIFLLFFFKYVGYNFFYQIDIFAGLPNRVPTTKPSKCETLSLAHSVIVTSQYVQRILVGRRRFWMEWKHTQSVFATTTKKCCMCDYDDDILLKSRDPSCPSGSRLRLPSASSACPEYRNLWIVMAFEYCTKRGHNTLLYALYVIMFCVVSAENRTEN